MSKKGSARMIDLDHAATTPVRAQVLEAMLPYFRTYAGNASGAYAAARTAREAIDRARTRVAAGIGAQPGEITFTSGGTESDNWALWGMIGGACAGKHVITTQVEHHAVLNACQVLERRGVEVTYLPVDAQGCVEPQSVRHALRPQTVLVSVMLANNEVGTIEPVRAISCIAHEHGVPVHTDAVQAVGHIPVDVDELGVDLLSLSAHKFGGPKGIGALYVRSGIRLEPLLYGGAQERGLRPGTENTPAIVGMGYALELAVQEMPEASLRTAGLRDALMRGILSSFPHARVNGSMAHRLPGNLHVTLPGIDTRVLLMRLDMAGIAASAGSACASGAVERSHVLRAMGVPEGERLADLRLTIGTENTVQDVEQTIGALTRILSASH